MEPEPDGCGSGSFGQIDGEGRAGEPLDLRSRAGAGAGGFSEEVRRPPWPIVGGKQEEGARLAEP